MHRCVLALVAIGVLTGLSSVAAPFSVVQFNTWGVPLAVKDTYRYAFAMEKLEELGPDFIVLNEVFSAKGKRAFHSFLYPFEANGPKAFPKLVSSGLRILSKHPILRTDRVEFCTCKGDDCLSRKGALLVLIALPDGTRINLLATHLNARGGDPVRIRQLEEITELLRRSADPEAPIVFSGDFNFEPGSAPYHWLEQNLGFRDIWQETHPADEPGYTYDAFENPYAHDYAIRTHFPLTKERIDLILHRDGARFSVTPKSSRIVLNERPWYSDHYGLLAEFESR